MIQDRPSWVNRPAIVAGIAFVIGAIVAGVVVAIILTSGDGDDNSTVDGNVTPGTTTTPVGTAAATITGTTTPGVSPTPPNLRNPDDALAAYVQAELGETYIGPCPQTPAGETPQGICSIELYRSAELVTFLVGPPFSEGIGEAVLTPAESGIWSVTFVPITNQPPVVGRQAVVIGAGDCLNFRASPGTGGESLSCQQDGNSADVVGGPQVADNVTWWQLKDLGWASVEFLQGAQ
jgi:hypothetical protein